MTGIAASRPIAAWISGERGEEVADQHHAGVARQRQWWRQADVVRGAGRPASRRGGRGRRGRRPGGRRRAISSTRSPPRSSSAARASSSRSARSRFSTGTSARAPAHRGGGVAPEADGLRGFPLGLADEPAVGDRAAGFGGLAPVDAGDRVAGDEAGGTARNCRPGRPGGGRARPAPRWRRRARRRPAAAAGGRRAPRRGAGSGAQRADRQAARARCPLPRQGASAVEADRRWG